MMAFHFLFRLIAYSTAVVMTLPAADRPQREVIKTAGDLEKALEVRGVWSSTGSTLKAELAAFRELTGITVLRDRRIDPHSLCEFPPNEGSRKVALSAISQTQNGLAWQQIGPTIYLGPRPAALRLPLLIEMFDEQLKANRSLFPAELTARLRRRTALRWNELTTPREILVQLCSTANVRLLNPEDVPHDLWAQAELPPMSFAEAAVLVLNQFDLTLIPDPTGGFSVGAPDRVLVWESSYAVGRTQRAAIEEQLLAAGLSPKLRWSASRVTVSGTINDHLWWSDRLQDGRLTEQGAANANPAGLRNRVFTLRVERATIGALITEFRRQGIRIEIADEDSVEVQAVMKLPIEVDAVQQEANAFFSAVFAEHFAEIEVTDELVRLSQPGAATKRHKTTQE